MKALHAMLEKAKNDKDFEAKLNALGESGAAPEAVIAFAAEHGFAITEDELNSCGGDCGKCGELTEEDLDKVAGGVGPTKDRYDSAVCPSLTRTRYECVGFLALVWCDHYKQTKIGWVYRGNTNDIIDIYKHTCNRRGFDYYGTSYGDPLHEDVYKQLL